MKTCYLILIGLLISGMSFSQITVKKVTSPPALDGLTEESFWDISNQIAINLNGSDNTASFGALWDDNYLYIGVNVLDGSLCTNGRQGWYDDGLEIYIDGNYSQGTSLDQYDRRFVKPVNSYWIQEAEERFEGVVSQWVETDNGYSMEFAIPWNNFNVIPATDLSIGFNVAVNDDDDSSQTFRLLWQGNSNYYKDPSCWGSLTLTDQSISYPGDYLALLSPNGGDFSINNNTTVIQWLSYGIANINLDYSTNDGISWNSIVTDLPANSQTFNWIVNATPSNQCRIRISDAANPSVNDISESQFAISAALTVVEPLIPNSWNNYQWPYNAYYPLEPNGINGHIGNACGHSSLARILHYWEFPVVGNDELTFTDNGGYTWSANFGETTYNYDNMPAYLLQNSTEAEYMDVATLFYHAATSMHDIGGSGTNLDNMSYAMKHYFNYKESNTTLRKDYTRSEWIQLMITELNNGRPLLVQGMRLENVDGCGDWHENDCIAGHWYHVDGYNEYGDFHVVVGYGNYDGFYDADSLIHYSYNLGILTGLEPNLNGKELSLQTHDGGETLITGEVSEIIWNSTNVMDVRLEYTIDNGKNWDVIINSTPAANGSYNWTVPTVITEECKIKLIDVSDINIYDKSDIAFSIKPYELTLISPNGGEYYIQGTSTSVHWESTPVANIKIEYSINNGQVWNEIVNSVSSSTGTYVWTIPETNSEHYKIRITDITNAAVFDKSDNTFEVGPPNTAGGPYAVDDSTILLMHFDNNLLNNSPLSDNGVPQGNGISYSSSMSSKINQCLKLDGNSYIIVPHNENLNLSGDWTLEAWINMTTYNPNAQSIIIRKPGDTDEYYSNYAFELHPWWGNVLHGFYFSNNSTRINITEMSLDLNQWYHVAFIRDVTNSLISITVRNENWNIISSNSRTFTDNNVLFSIKDLRIGENFNGYIDEIRISNVVRDFPENQVANLPIVSNIPDQTINEGESFTPINLDDFVYDADNPDSEIIWSYSGNSDLGITIDAARVATITSPNSDWFGSETIIFKATDLMGNSDSNEVICEVVNINDAPVVIDIPDQAINEGASFTTITFDDFVSDIDNPDNEIIWSYSGNSELGITIDASRVATITPPNSGWTGSESITFTATDPEGGHSSDDAVFTRISTNIKEYYSDSALFSIYPNPAQESVYINSLEFGELSINSLTGQKIIEKSHFSSGDVDISRLKKGIYLVVFLSEKKIASRKLIIDK